MVCLIVVQNIWQSNLKNEDAYSLTVDHGRESMVEGLGSVWSYLHLQSGSRKR